jgi:hypothetical protein
MYVSVCMLLYEIENLRLFWISQLGRCFRLNYRLPTVSDTFSFGFVRFQTTEYVPFVSVSGISVFVSVRLKNVKVKTGDVFFQPFLSVFRPTSTSTGAFVLKQDCAALYVSVAHYMEQGDF